MDYIFPRFARFAVITAWILLVTGCSDGTSFPADNNLVYEQGDEIGTVGGGDTGTGGAEGGSLLETVPAEGLWRGLTSTDRAIVGAVLDDDTYWFVYSIVGNNVLVGNTYMVGGFVQGTGVASNGSFTSDDGRDFTFEGPGVLGVTLDSAAVRSDIFFSTSLNGSIEYSSGTVTFESSYDSDYEDTPNLADIAGTYTVSVYTSGGRDPASVTITSGGGIDILGSSGCAASGSLSPRANGNIYNVSIAFGGGVCVNGTDTLTGIAHFYSANQELTVAGVNGDRTSGFVILGTR